ncbi:MAG: lysylphosphatidylglycerol synthase transmembrane domain-containing protein [Saprospiraceae bacterium]
MTDEAQNIENDKEDEQTRSILKSFRRSKIVWPVIIGLLAMVFMFSFGFDKSALKAIQWSPHTLTWLCLAVVMLLIRDTAYVFRLHYLAGDKISFWRCVRLIIIWEFSSAVAPTSIGGSAVAVVFLSNEKLGTPRTLATIIYTVILDKFFFLISIPLLILVFGPNVIQPGYTTFSSIGKVGFSLAVFYCINLAYGLFFTYGLFFNPNQFKKIVVFFTRLPLLTRFKAKAIKLGDEMIISANVIADKDWRFHIKPVIFTWIAWSARFIIVNFLIIALIDQISYHPWDQLKIFGREVIMFVFMMFSPTPGAAGFAEVFFGNFIGDYVPKSAALIIAFIWRFLTYYVYLIAGAIVIPPWLAGLIRQRLEDRKLTKADNA